MDQHSQQAEELVAAAVEEGTFAFVAAVVVAAAEVTIGHMDYLVDSIGLMLPYWDLLGVVVLVVVRQTGLQMDHPHFVVVVVVVLLQEEALRKDFRTLQEEALHQMDRLSLQVAHHHKDSVAQMLALEQEELRMDSVMDY
jgi:hypothetical protein